MKFDDNPRYESGPNPQPKPVPKPPRPGGDPA